MLKYSKSISDAKVQTTSFSIAVEQAFLSKQKGMKIKELGLREMLADSEQSAKWKEMFDIFDEETISTFNEIVKGLPGAIDSFINEEMTQRPLSSLKTDFLE